MIKYFEPGRMDEIMHIWLYTNIRAHDFIDANYWNSLFDEVRAALPSSSLFVFEENGVIKGFIGITGGQYIAGLFVLEEYQSRGIGRKLLDHCKQHYPRLELDVFAKNEKAVEFYKRNGFAVSGISMNPDFHQEEYRMLWTRKFR